MKISSHKRRNHGIAGMLLGVLLLGAVLLTCYPAYGRGSKEDEKSAITTETVKGPGVIPEESSCPGGRSLGIQDVVKRVMEHDCVFSASVRGNRGRKV